MPRLIATLRFLLQASAFGLAEEFLVALLRPDWARDGILNDARLDA